MARITPQLAGGINAVAFLDMLAWSEGTDNGKQPTKDHGYDVIVGGQLFSDYADHPRVLVSLPKLGIKSTAAGRYQFLARTWESLQRRMGLPDFGPLSQDKACIRLIEGRGALSSVKAGHIQHALALCSKEWASLPGAGYGQHERKVEDLLAVYRKAGGVVVP